LEATGYESLGRLECRVDGGRIELSGMVPTFYLKQVAQSIALRLESVKEVRNLVEVV
jgi:hypothetical protein